MKNPKSPATLVAIIIAVVVLSGVIYIVQTRKTSAPSSGNEPTPQPNPQQFPPTNVLPPGTLPPGWGTPTVSVSIPSGWKAYEDTQYSVAWSYPGERTLGTTQAGITGTKKAYVMKKSSRENEITDFYFSIREPNTQKIINLNYIPAGVNTLEALQAQLSKNCADANAASVGTGVVTTCNFAQGYGVNQGNSLTFVTTGEGGSWTTIYFLRNNLIYSFYAFGDSGSPSVATLSQIAQTFHFTK